MTKLPPESSTAKKLLQHQEKIAEAVTRSNMEAVRKQKMRNKKSARERIEMLLDPDSFVEIDELVQHSCTHFGMEKKRPYGDGVVIGYGTIDSRQVAVYSQDFNVFGGSLGEAYGAKVVKILDFAMRTGCPIIGINDGGGARIQEGVFGLAKFAEIFKRNVEASGVIPQISLIMGPSAGGAAYSPALTDYIVMVDKTSHMFITGPDVIKTVTGETVDMESLGGAETHNKTSGNAHYLATDEKDAIDYVKDLLSYLPSNNFSEPPMLDTNFAKNITSMDKALNTLIPDSPNQPYDMRNVIESVVDEEEFLEIQPLFAPNILIGYARVDGRSVGIVANQPMCLAGTLDIAASEKAARFVRNCDAFNIPIITLVDVPGFLPGTSQEWDGIIRRGAKLLYAYAEATVPLLTLITRKAYGGAYIVMGSKRLGADINLAWPTAQIAVMGATGAVNILYKKQLQDFVQAGEDVTLKNAEFVKNYEDTFANPYIAAQRGLIDKVIQPEDTRITIVKALRALVNKRATLPPKKHGNIPL